MSLSLFSISAWLTSYYFFEHCSHDSQTHHLKQLFYLISFHQLLNDTVNMIRLIVESSFELTFWTRIEIGSNCSHFQLDLSWVAHIFNLTRLDSTGNWVNLTRLVKNLSLTSRELNIEIFPVFDFCITFLHYFLIESHEEKHEDRLIENHEEKHEESHDEEHEEKHEDRLTLIESHDGETW